MLESIGKRIALLRQKNGWTQQSFADRMAMSRVAISHIEMDLSLPSERSITLMAGAFKLSPTELVEGTSYPKAKAERLPGLTTIYTDLEMNFALFHNDLEWLDQITEPGTRTKLAWKVLHRWRKWIEERANLIVDEHELEILDEMRHKLRNANDKLDHPLE